ncbi:MAG: enoyl-CoA hydratase [Candidatus Binatota bacterium]|jgi:enoyl-CoA hydratase|nr:enoyl-CoA hydratase [Candidatus Binatota bacterium]
MPDVLLLERNERVATLTLNRPAAMNALSRELRRALVDGFHTVAGDDDVGVVILTGSGRAFCAGLDLKELGGEAGREAGADGEIGSGADIIRAMEECRKPIIGGINGFAITGGFEVALACDVLVASVEARFADTHARVGLLPGWGLSQKLPRLIGIHRAKELSLTGNYLSAERAEAWGLVNRVVAAEELLPACRALAQDMLSCDEATMRGYKRLIDRGFALAFGEALELERRESRDHARRVDRSAIAERRRTIQDRGRTQR